MNRPARPRAAASRHDAGETLVEILVSVVILGIAVAAILGGIGMSATASSTHQSLTRTQNLLRDWAETLTWSSACPTVVPAFGLPAGFTATPAPAVSYWKASSADFTASCASNDGMYRVRLTVLPPATQGPALAQTLDVVVRQPCEGPVASPC